LVTPDDLAAIEARPPLMARHDDGCQCWPHVTEADAIEAVRLEYLEGRKAVAAERARIAEAVRGLPPTTIRSNDDDISRAAVLAIVEKP
jgi:hypothetical protein